MKSVEYSNTAPLVLIAVKNQIKPDPLNVIDR